MLVFLSNFYSVRFFMERIDNCNNFQYLSLFTFTIFSNYHYHITHKFSLSPKLNFLGNIKQLNSVEYGGVHLSPDTQKKEREKGSYRVFSLTWPI